MCGVVAVMSTMNYHSAPDSRRTVDVGLLPQSLYVDQCDDETNSMSLVPEPPLGLKHIPWNYLTARLEFVMHRTMRKGVVFPMSRGFFIAS